MACSDKAGTADKVQAAAGTLADLLAHVADYPLAGTGRDWATERARVLTAAHLNVMAPVLEAIERLEKPARKYPEAAAWMREQARLEDEAREVIVGDRFEWLPPSEFAGQVGTVTKSDGHTSRFLKTGDFARWFSSATLNDPAQFRRLSREPEGVKVGDTFRRVSGRDKGKVFEATELGAPFDVPSVFLQGYGWQDFGALSNAAKWERVRAVDVAHRYEPDGNERLATAEELAVPARDVACCFCVKSGEAYALLDAGRKCPRCGKSESDLVSAECDSEWGGMEPEDSGVDDLAGPAGDERAGVPTDAAQALDAMTEQRDRLLDALHRSGAEWRELVRMLKLARDTRNDEALHTSVIALSARAGLL